MSIDAFIQTKLFGLLFSLFCLVVYGYLLYQLGGHIAYKRGWKDGRADNPKPEVVVITEYVYDNKRIARFDPRVPDVFLLIDMKGSTIARIPYNVPLEKQVLAKPDTDAKENREG